MELTARVQNKLLNIRIRKTEFSVKDYVEKLDKIEEQFQKVTQKTQKEKEIESNSVPNN
jgi:hypothetical protein